MPQGTLTRFALLPELELLRVINLRASSVIFETTKARAHCEICPRCAQPSSSIYDHRSVLVKDLPIRGDRVRLRIRKRRYYCKQCRKPFTEPVQGIMPKRRSTQRFRRGVLWACDNFSDLTKVRRAYKCSSAFIYKVLYEQLELKLREYQYPWPDRIGIDEHFFSRSNEHRFATVITDMRNKRLREVCLGKTGLQLRESLAHIKGRENVKYVALDLSDAYKTFAMTFFPNAELVADKFHVLRLLSPHLIRHRKNISGSMFTTKAKRMLTRSSKNLDYEDRITIWRFLDKHPELKEIYSWKERMHEFYRIKGYYRAQKALGYMLAEMQNSKLKEIKTLCRTLTRWQNEVLNYFKTGLTNARTEGFNNVAKLVQKRAYGYKSFRNYRLRLLSACAF